MHTEKVWIPVLNTPGVRKYTPMEFDKTISNEIDGQLSERVSAKDIMPTFNTSEECQGYCDVNFPK